MLKMETRKRMDHKTSKMKQAPSTSHSCATVGQKRRGNSPNSSKTTKTTETKKTNNSNSFGPRDSRQSSWVYHGTSPNSSIWTPQKIWDNWLPNSQIPYMYRAKITTPKPVNARDAAYSPNKHDPSVPHLKYGLFPKKTHRGRSQVVGTSPSVYITTQSNEFRTNRAESPTYSLKSGPLETRRYKTGWPAISKTSTLQKTISRNQSKWQGKYPDCDPVFIFRPLAHGSMRSLSFSASTHLDIKPKLQRWPIIIPSQMYSR